MSSPQPQTPSANLIIQFDGWALIRLPTDPDPADETRGVSGYTFAFGDEPDLDRVVYLQPPPGFTPRSYSHATGVYVRQATRQVGADRFDVAALVGARVELLDRPMLENRNWNLTLPGYEPIVPFHLRVAGNEIAISRRAPLDPGQPDEPLWQVPSALLQAQGARGMEYEPETVGRATQLWDTLEVARERLANLQADRDRADRDGASEAAIAILAGRIAELEFAIANPTDRRTVARNFVERFGFAMQGAGPQVDGDEERLLGGKLDRTQPWSVNFWLGGWDPDLLQAFMQGSLMIPYASVVQ